jgi:hypothetical protein
MADHIVLPVARAEYLAEYAQQLAGGPAAASRFEREFVQAVADIRAWPELWPLVQDDTFIAFAGSRSFRTCWSTGWTAAFR